MVKFLDGPAAGVTLSLRRIPKLLRVVRSAAGEWDALDQLDDTPATDEKMYVYRRRDDLDMTKYHLLFRGKDKRQSGYYWNASYSVRIAQPRDSDVRDTAAWQAWATARADEPERGWPMEETPSAKQSPLFK
jgi:hypothetical protein